ncbi:hypothetical protein ITP53_38025 [Nonomuraea sp. K274]|uniref:Uncharacterized protein n=1 Tax=Nonomuraea cypriaca TaxID=1187855 RepID=A0A931AEH7_9ACTN|nr:hypothetical protein [Nonomuraea cypriaca]MBF8191401.1 hypothetical protein [Nonomuraea cypriaca]
MRPGKAVASFDSASGMLRALSRFLHDRDVPLIGQGPAALEGVVASVLGAANRLPRGLQERAYALGGWAEAVPLRRAGEIRSDAPARWVTGSGRRPSRRRQFCATSSAHDQYASSNAGFAALARTPAYDSCAGTSGGPRP